MNYPQREQFYSHRFCRLLTKTAAAQDIGPEACWLLTVIAHQEDSKRYKGPVTYWNEQLMPLCGFGSRERLVLAREKAVVAGWLYYEPGRKSVPGRYWTLIPPQYEDLPDTPIEESSDGFCRSEIERQDKCRSETERHSDGNHKCRSETERKPERHSDGNPNGKPTPFYPIPIPNPERERAHFVAPTEKEVADYCREHNLTRTNPAEFIDHFASNGWKVGGKSEMKDWRASLRNWERREKKFAAAKSNGKPPPPAHDRTMQRLD